METVYIVQDPDLGYDCVVGIFYNEEDAEECVKDRPFSNCSIFVKYLEEHYNP